MTFAKVRKEEFYDLLEININTRTEITFSPKGSKQSYKATMITLNRQNDRARLKFALPSDIPDIEFKNGLFTFHKENLFYFFTADFKNTNISNISNLSKKDLRSSFRLTSSNEYPIKAILNNICFDCFDLSLGGLSILAKKEQLPEKIINMSLEILNRKIQLPSLTEVYIKKAQNGSSKIGFQFSNITEHIETEIFKAVNDVIFAKNGKLETNE